VGDKALQMMSQGGFTTTRGANQHVAGRRGSHGGAGVWVFLF
jgi:hypothetical protein